ncbi:MAG: UbiD family decarboxylase [Chloroflexi bacterium]|nr:UbiD family decarboxylase [Chloroflexota bacterium]
MKIANDMREFMDQLEERGELLRIRREVDPNNFEIPAYIRQCEDGVNKAILFEKVKGYPGVSVVANLFGSIRRCAIGCAVRETPEDVERYGQDPHCGPGGMGGNTQDPNLGWATPAEDRAALMLVRQKILAAEQAVKEGARFTKIVPTGPCKEVIITKDIDLMGTLPMPWLCEKDAAPFINPGILVQKDPNTGVLNLGCRRHQVGGPYGKDKIGAFVINTTDGGKIVEKWEDLGKPGEVALCLGVDPAVEVMGCYNTTHFMWSDPASEYEMVGAMMGRTIELVKCETVDILVPATTEIVIEGIMPPGERILEGPMSEFTDVYTWRRHLPYIQITAITHRKNPSVHVLLSGRSREHCTLSLLATPFGTEQRILARARPHFPTVKDIAIYAGSQNFHLVASLKKRFEGEDKLLLYWLMSNTFHKYVTIVDDDVEPHNSEMVEWARATRAGANADDFLVFPKTHTWEMDPEIDNDKMVTRLGILATLPYGQAFQRSGPPMAMVEKIQGDFEQELAGR